MRNNLSEYRYPETPESPKTPNNAYLNKKTGFSQKNTEIFGLSKKML